MPTPASSSPTPTAREALRAAADLLDRAGVPSPRVDAELLACHVWGIDRSALFTMDRLPQGALAQFWELVERRADRVPLQHLTGETWFRHLTLEVRAGVFVPRPETEMVAEVAILDARDRPRPVRIVDLCTGAGGIAISCAQEVPGANVWAVDISPEAVALAEANADRNSCEVHTVRADVRSGPLLPELAGAVDVVVSNPPYIPFDAEPVDAEVRDYDPPAALYGGGEDGLEVPAAVVDRAHELLRPGGLLVVEHGDEQGAAMRALVTRRGGFTGVHTRGDLTGRDRMVVATRLEVAH